MYDVLNVAAVTAINLAVFCLFNWYNIYVSGLQLFNSNISFLFSIRPILKTFIPYI